METRIGFAPGAEDNDLGRWLGSSLERGLQASAARARAFRALRGSVAFVAPDRKLSVTLRFDHGLCSILEGLVGTVDVTLCADFAELSRLAQLMPASLSWSRPALREGLGQALPSWAWMLGSLLDGRLRIYGLLAHPRFVGRILLLLGAEGSRDAATA